MRKDYLRILRWLRFHGRYSLGSSLDEDASRAAMCNASGLAKISRERIWVEVSKIITGNDAVRMMAAFYDLGLAMHCDLPPGDFSSLEKHVLLFTRNSETPDLKNNAVALMVSLLGTKVFDVAESWKWSNKEKTTAHFLVKYCHCREERDFLRLIAHEQESLELVALLAIFQGYPELVTRLSTWEVPIFPINGVDLIEIGIQPCRRFGKLLTELRHEWTNSDYTLSREDLLTLAKITISLLLNDILLYSYAPLLKQIHNVNLLDKETKTKTNDRRG